MKLQLRGNLGRTQRTPFEWIFWTMTLKSSHQHLSNEGSNFLLSSLEVAVVSKKVHKISFLDLKWQFSRGGMREGKVATPTSFSIFDSYDVKSL